MMSLPVTGYELQVELLGEEPDEWLGALELLLGRRRGDALSDVSGETASAAVWRFGARSDAEHAGELARGLLDRGQVEFRVWLLRPGLRARWLLSVRGG
jgi:hypothetical protein